MTKRKWIFVVILVLCLPFGAWAQEAEEIIKNSPGPDQYPDAGALILLHEKDLRVGEEGNYEISEHLVVKIFNDRGKKEFGDIKKRFDQRWEKIIVEKARTFKEDGTVIEVPDNAKNIITPPELSAASIYANVQQMVVSFPGLEKNSIIDYRARLRSDKPPEDRYFWGSELFGGNEPILKKEFSISLPQGKELKYKPLNGLSPPQVERLGGRVKYTWRISDSPQITPEPAMPPLEEVVPRLLYTSFGSWVDVGRWLGGKFFPQVEVGGGVQAKASELCTGLNSDEEKIRVVFLWVATQVRNVQLRLGDGGYTPHPASAVLHNRYGDPRDKGLLLISLLKAEGIEAWPGLVNNSDQKVSEEIPSPGQFDGLLVAIPQTGKTIWLDPFAQNCLYGYLPFADGQRCLLVKRDRGLLTQTGSSSARENLVTSRLKISLEEDGSASGELKLLPLGYFDLGTREKLKDLTPQLQRMSFQEAANILSEGTELKGYHLSRLQDLTQLDTLGFTFQTPQYGIKEGDLMLVKIPPNPFPFADIPVSPKLSERRYPLLSPKPLTIEVEGTITIPQGYKVDYLPPQREERNGLGFFRQSFKQAGGEVTFRSQLSWEKREITPEEYPQFKGLYEEFTHPQNSLLILEENR